VTGQIRGRLDVARIEIPIPTSLPGDVSASQRYWNPDIIEPAVEVTARGTIHAPKSPGIGYAVKRKLVEELTVRQNVWSNGSGAN